MKDLYRILGRALDPETLELQRQEIEREIYQKLHEDESNGQFDIESQTPEAESGDS